MKVFFYILSLIFLPLSLLAQGEVKFEVTTDAKQIVKGNYVEVSFTLHNAQGIHFQPPRFSNFDIVAGPHKFSRSTFVNGRGSSTYGFTYVLNPRKEGRIRLEKARITVDGKVYETKPIVVEVVKGNPSNGTAQNNGAVDLEQEVFIQAIVSTENAIIGEQIILDYKLYTTQNIRNYEPLSMPEFQGFFAEDIRHYDGRVLKEVVDGKQFNTKVLERITLFPQQTGLLKIEPMNWELFVATGERSGLQYRGRRVRVKTNELNINVRSIPDGAPTSFNGAVGQFTAFANINKRVMTTDDAISLKMTVKGDGDIKRVLPPYLELSKDTFETYEPRMISEESTERGGKIVSTKVFEYLLLPKIPGRYNVTPSFSFFDPDTMLFMLMPMDTFPLEVRQGTGKTNYDQEEEIVKVTEELRPIKLEHNFETTSGFNFFGSGFFWILLLIPFLLLGGAYFYKQHLEKQRNVDQTLLKMKGASKVAQQKLAKAKEYQSQQNSGSFYDEVSNASLGYVCDKLNISNSELTKANVKSKLVSLNVDESSINQFMQILQTCEMARFAGKDNADAMQATYQSTIDVITNIEEQLLTVNYND